MIKVFIIYVVLGVFAVVARRELEKRGDATKLLLPYKQYDFKPERRISHRVWSVPFVPIVSFLLFGALFLPREPWQHMTSTLVYDVVGTMSSVILNKTLRNLKGNCQSDTLGRNPLGTLNYQPADDPYYITNLNSPIDPFIAKAIEGIQFTNIFHIILESLRADVYPFNETGPFMDHITQNFELVPDGPAITTSNITPFVESIAEHVISWERVWSTIPFTHKALIGGNYLSTTWSDV